MNEEKLNKSERYFARAVKARDAGDYKTARRWFMRVVEQEPKRASCWMMVAFCDTELDNHVEALRSMRRAERRSPKNGRIQGYIGKTQLELNRPMLAERALRKSVNIIPYAPAYIFLFVALFRQGREREGVAFLRLALKLEPDNEEAHYNLGSYYYRLKQWNRAEKHLRRATDIDPKYALAYSELGNVLFRKKRSLSGRCKRQ